MKKIILSILLITLILSGCNNKPEKKPADPETVYDGSYYVEQLREFRPKEKNKDNNKRNEDFEQLLQGVFEEKAVAYFLDFHYNIDNYKALGLEKPEATLGEYKYELDKEEIAYYSDLLNELRSYDYASLSYEQQYDYDTLEFDCLSRLADLCFYKYRFLLKAGEGVPDSLASYFTDYSFKNEEEIEDYLTCLKDVPRVYDEVLVYTKAQAEDGYPLLDEWIDHYQETAASFIESGEENELIVSFNRRLDACDFLSTGKRNAYKQENKEIIISELCPAYEKLKTEIEQYRGKADVDDYRFAAMDDDYADLVYMLKGSSSYTPDQMFAFVADALSTLEAEYMSAIYEEEPFKKSMEAIEGKYEIFTRNLTDTLAYLAEHSKEYFPELGDIKYTVEYLDPRFATETVAAYYWQAPIDNDDQNIIRVNPNNKDALTYRPYGTMAHEGFPGHLYQTIYYHRQDPSRFRFLLNNNLGYLEGWAEYCTYYAYRMAGLNDDLAASVMFYDTNAYFLEYTLIDLLRNYYGYSAEEICDYFTENSQFPQSVEYYEVAGKILTEYAGQYIPYGVGMAFMLELRDECQRKLGDSFDIIAYNKAVLDSGIMPLNVLRQSVYEKLNISE